MEIPDEATGMVLMRCIVHLPYSLEAWALHMEAVTVQKGRISQDPGLDAVMVLSCPGLGCLTLARHLTHTGIHHSTPLA